MIMLLDAEQAALVAAADGPLLVQAGPGTGKSRLLVERVAYLITVRRVAPALVLVVTFSRRAAGELRRRVAERLGPAIAGSVRVTTAHALGRAIIARWPGVVGYRAGPLPVLGEQSLLRLVAELLPGSASPAERLALAGQLWPALALVRQGLPPPVPWAGPGESELRVLAAGLNARLRAGQAVDYVSMLTLPLAILARDPLARQVVQAASRYVLVDEVQDLSRLQWLLVRTLVAGHGNLLAVGDPAQAIYGFRGGWPALMERFALDLPGGRVAHLSRTYRTRPALVAVANQLRGQVVGGRPLVAVRPPGGLAVHWSLADEHQEAALVISEVRRLRATGQIRHLGEAAVLARTHAHVAALASACRRAALPVIQRPPARPLTGPVPAPLTDGSPGAGPAERLALLTVHAAKGLEFAATFVLGWEEGGLLGGAATAGAASLADEARLAYVGLTRARDYLYLTSCRVRAGQPRAPSRWLASLPLPTLPPGRVPPAAG